MFARGLTALAMTLLLAAPAVAQEEAPPPPAAPPEAPPPAVAPAPVAAPAAAALGKKYLTPGIIEIGGGITLGFWAMDVEGSKLKEFNLGLSPYVLYFVIKNLAVGGRFTVQYGKFWSSGGGTSSSSSATTIAIQPAAEYHFDLGSKIYPYVGLALGYGWADNFSGLAINANDNQFVVNIGGGVKMTFGGGIIGVGLEVPITVHNPDATGAGTYTQAGFNLFTRYAIWF